MSHPSNQPFIQEAAALAMQSLPTFRQAKLRRLRLKPAPHPLAPGVVGLSVDLGALDAEVGGSELEFLPEAVRRCTRARQMAFIGGRICAEGALAQLGLEGARIDREPGGAPAWPAGFVGSIAHTDATAFAAVATEAKVRMLGIDSEPIANHDGARSIVELCCTVAERERWFPGAPSAELATLLFSAKESFYKAIYPTLRRFVDFTEVELRQVSFESSTIELAPAPASCLADAFGPMSLKFAMDRGVVHAAMVAIDADHFAICDGHRVGGCHPYGAASDGPRRARYTRK